VGGNSNVCGISLRNATASIRKGMVNNKTGGTRGGELFPGIGAGVSPWGGENKRESLGADTPRGGGPPQRKQGKGRVENRSGD